MEYKAAEPHYYGAPTTDPHLYSAPAPLQHHHFGSHQQQQTIPQTYPPSYPYYPNPNPNPDPVPKHDPVTSVAPTDAAFLRPPGVDPYLHHPFAPHSGYEGYQGLPYSYPTAAAATPAALPPSYYHGAPGGEVQYGVSPLSYGPTQKSVQKQTTFEDLETKKRKLIAAGTTAESLRACAICNVVCNSDAVFATHLAGEKHAIKALGRPSNGMAPPKLPAHEKFAKSKKASVTKVLKKTPKVIQTVHCEVCKLECNSQEVLNIHKVGKRHKRNMQKLQESITAKPAASEQKKATTPATAVDLQTKKQKVLDSGTAADAVRVCTLCNIVCNSQTVFDYHVAGQKHIATVNQQQRQQAPVS